MSGRPCVSVLRGSTREVVEFNADGRLTIGREASDFIIDDPRVSRRHLRLKLDGETVSACDESTNGTKLNGIRMVGGEVVTLKEGDELRIVLKKDMQPKPPHAICAEQLKVVFVFHWDVDEARRRVAQATAQATAASATPAATAAAAASSDKAAEAAAEQAEISMHSAHPACVSRPCSAALSAPPPARRTPFTVLSPQQAGTPPSPPPRPSAEDDMKNKEMHKLPRLAADLLGSFHPSVGNSLSGTPDGEPIAACVAALAQVRAQSEVLGAQHSEALALYHKEKYPTSTNQTYTSLVEIVDHVVKVRGTGLRVGISGAADGELGKLVLAKSHPNLVLYQSDLRPGQAPGIYGIDDDAQPLTEDGSREPDGTTDVALARNCFYSLRTSFLTLLSMCRVLRQDGVLAVCCIRKQFGNVSAFMLEAELVGILTLATLVPIRLHSSGNGTFDGFKIEAVRTSVPICAISRLPQLLGSTCGALGSGGCAQLAKTMRAGLSVAIEREAVELRVQALPYSRGRLEHAYTSVAAGEAVLRWSGILSSTDATVLESTAVEIEACGARMTLAAISTGLRSGLGILERFERLNASRLEVSTAATNDQAKLAALRSEPAGIAELFGSPMVELLGGYGSTPCIYFAHDAHAGGFKVGDASCGVHMRYSGESGVTALPMVLTQTSLSAASKGGRPDTDGFRSFAREALETLFTVAIGGGLGKASSIFGSVATLGAKPGRTSTSLKPGFVGATPAQLKVILKPGLVGATPAQLKGIFKPGWVGATPAQLAAQLALKGAPRSSRLSKGQLEAATPAQLQQQKRKEREAGYDLSCTRCNFKIPKPKWFETPPIECPPLLRAWLPSPPPR